MIEFLKRQRVWVLQYLIAITITIALLYTLRLWAVAPEAKECTEKGGIVMHEVRNFLCIDSGGHVIPI